MHRFYYGWIVALAAALVGFGGSGARFSFGVFLKPMTEQFGWDRRSLALAASITLLLGGLLRPPLGWLVDRFGVRIILAISLVISAFTLLALSFLTQLWHAYLLYGLLAVGFVGASPISMTKLISEWFVRRRGLAMSISSSGGALGELAIVPLAMFILLHSDWQTAYRALAVMVALIILPVAVLAVRDSPREMGLFPDGDPEEHTAGKRGGPGESLRLTDALKTAAFWQLTFGFFVCGYTMSFAQTHFVPYATDMGIEEMTAAGALGTVGGFSILGTLLLGALSDRYRRKYLLALVYVLRGLASFILLQVAGTPAILYAGGLVLGLSWTATVPLTSAIVADRYGVRNLGVIFGTMFMVMIFGSSTGAYVDGLIYDLLGSYHTALYINIGAGVAAGLVVLGVHEKRLVPAYPPVGKPTPVA